MQTWESRLKSARLLDLGATHASRCTPCTVTTTDDERTLRACKLREIELSKESEFRFELEAGAPMAIRVRSISGPKHCLPVWCNGPDQVVAGNAEVYGSEMAPGRTYVFSQECRAAINSWEGCMLEMSPLRRSAQGTGLTPWCSFKLQARLQLSMCQKRPRWPHTPIFTYFPSRCV